MVSVLLRPWKPLKKENMKLLVNVREKEDKVLEVIDVMSHFTVVMRLYLECQHHHQLWYVSFGCLVGEIKHGHIRSSGDNAI